MFCQTELMELYIATFETGDGYTYSSSCFLGVFDTEVLAMAWCEEAAKRDRYAFKGDWEPVRGTETWFRATDDAYTLYEVSKSILNTGELL